MDPLPGTRKLAQGFAANHRAMSPRPMPNSSPAVHTAGSPSWTEAMPPQAVPKSPVSFRLRSMVHGEWSEAMWSMVPSLRPSHRALRLSSSRSGGQHLYSVAPSGMSSEAKVR